MEGFFIATSAKVFMASFLASHADDKYLHPDSIVGTLVLHIIWHQSTLSLSFSISTLYETLPPVDSSAVWLCFILLFPVG